MHFVYLSNSSLRQTVCLHCALVITQYYSRKRMSGISPSCERATSGILSLQVRIRGKCWKNGTPPVLEHHRRVPVVFELIPRESCNFHECWGAIVLSRTRTVRKTDGTLI